MKRANDLPWWKRVFTPANILSVAAGIFVFVLGRIAWDTNRGALVSAIIAALVTGTVWLAWWSMTKVPALETILDAERLGTIPEDGSSPAPTLIDPMSRSSVAYRDTINQLEGHTRGRVLLVSSPGPGQGATTVALNLAVAATQEGRRVLLIDGDSSGHGISRFMSTGPEPGLTDLAEGKVTLSEATRLWQLAEGSAMPVIPSGSASDDDVATRQGAGLEIAIDRVAERADLILIDSPPILWDETPRVLAQQAHGTLLVVTEAAAGSTVGRANDRLESAGAPVVGYVVNRVEEASFWQLPVIRMFKRSLTAFALIAIIFAGYTGVDLWDSWRGVERQGYDVAAAAAALPTTSTPPVADVIVEENDVPLEEVVVAEDVPDSAYRSFLLIGGDESGGAADVIMLLVLPTDDSEPFMVSLPRDLYLPNRCTGDYSRINATIHGCTAVNGPTLLSLTVEDFTGITVDHFAMFDFDGFEEIIDSIGGVEICVDNAVRDSKAHLELPAGCTNATGEQALAWVRSRHTQQLVGGRWRSVPGTSDLTRNQHQQDVIIELFKKLKTFDSPTDLTSKVSGLADAFTLDDQLSLTDAIALGWQMRDVSLDSIRRLEVAVKLARTKEGRSVLVPTIPFHEMLAEQYPELLEALTPGDPNLG
jgi:LCP family protein required for cell wall assembly